MAVVEALGNSLGGEEGEEVNATKREVGRGGEPRNRRLIALAVAGLLILGLGAVLAYYVMQIGQSDQHQLYKHLYQQRISQLKEVGLDEEKAKKFDRLFNKYTTSNKYNSTLLEFAKHFNKDESFALGVLNNLKNFKDSIEFIKKVDELNIDREVALQFLSRYSDVVLNRKFEYPLKLYSKNSTIFDIVYFSIIDDTREIPALREIILDMVKKIYGYPYPPEREKVRISSQIISELISQTSKLFLDLNFAGKVKVLDLHSNSYTDQYLSRETINAVGNYSIAVHLLKMSIHDRETLFRIFNATQIDPTFYNYLFKSVYIKDFRGNVHEIKSSIPARDLWVVAYHFQIYPEMLKKPEMWIPITIKSMQNALDLYEYSMFKAGPRFNLTDPRSLEVIEKQFRFYLDYKPIFPAYNYTKQKELIKNENDLIIANRKLFEIPFFIDDWDKVKEERRMNRMVLTNYWDENAAIYYVNILPKVREEIESVYPDLKILSARLGPLDIRARYYDWLGDTQVRGLFDTVKKYSGLVLGVTDWMSEAEKEKVRKVMDMIDLNPNLAIELDTPHSYLFKNLEYGDKLMFILSYCIHSFGDYASLRGLTSTALKAFGIPTQCDGFEFTYYNILKFAEKYEPDPEKILMSRAIRIEPIIFGISDDILEGLKKYGEYLRLPGNGITLPAVLYFDALEEDVRRGEEFPYAYNLRSVSVRISFGRHVITVFSIGEP